MIEGERTSSSPFEESLTSTPSRGRPTEPGRLSSIPLAATTGAASVRPYPSTSGRPKPINSRATPWSSGAPPLIATRSRPPKAASTGIATDRLSTGQSNCTASPGLAVQLLWPILKRYVAMPVLAAFGGRLRVAISGGAPLDQGVARLLIGLGLPLVEGYGLTEAAPVVAANGIDDNLPGSVGRPLDGVEVKLSSKGELLVRSPSIMMGYWRDDGETARALVPTGWLSTGDVAEINEDGRIFMRGRMT